MERSEDRGLRDPRRPLAYPGGSFDDRAEEIVKRFYRTARIWTAGGPGAGPVVYNDRSTSPYRLDSINISAQVSFDEFRQVIDGAVDA